MHGFTPVIALLGGLLIGISAVLLLFLNGRLAGISSIASGLLRHGIYLSPDKSDAVWRLIFLVGLIVGAAFEYALFGDAPVPRASFPAWLLIVSGLLVGFGTSLANGCTSGHGVCGLARFSVRSLAATATFLLTGIITTYIVRHVFGVQ